MNWLRDLAGLLWGAFGLIGYVMAGPTVILWLSCPSAWPLLLVILAGVGLCLISVGLKTFHEGG